MGLLGRDLDFTSIHLQLQLASWAIGILNVPKGVDLLDSMHCPKTAWPNG